MEITKRRALLVCAGFGAVCWLSSCSDRLLSFNGAMSRGDAMFRQGNFEQASRYYQIAVHRNPIAGAAYIRLGLAQANAGIAAGAIANLQRGLDVLPRSDPRRKAIRVHIADLALAQVQNAETLDEAQATGMELMSTNPGDYDGLRIFGAVMLARAQWLRTRDGSLYDRTIHIALECLAAADQARPGQTEVSLTRARILGVMGRLSEAETRYRSLLDQNPRADAMRAELYRLLLLERKRSEAREVLLAGARTSTHPEWFLIMLAAQDWIDQDRPGTKAALDQLEPMAKSQLRLCILVGDFRLRHGDVMNALREYQGCPVGDAASSNLRDERLITALSASGKSQAADSLVEALLKRDPRNSMALTFQGRVEIKSGEPARALRVLEQAVTEDPGNYEARLEAARAHLELGEVELARLRAGQALQLRADFLPALLLTAQIQFKREEYRGAARTISQMLAVDGENREARLMDAVLRDRVGSSSDTRSLSPRMAQIGVQIASGRFEDAARLFGGKGAAGSRVDRGMPSGMEAGQSGSEGRFVYLKGTEYDDAVARYQELAAKPDDPFVLAKAVSGPWDAQDRPTPRFPLIP